MSPPATNIDSQGNRTRRSKWPTEGLQGTEGPRSQIVLLNPPTPASSAVAVLLLVVLSCWLSCWLAASQEREWPDWTGQRVAGGGCIGSIGAGILVTLSCDAADSRHTECHLVSLRTMLTLLSAPLPRPDTKLGTVLYCTLQHCTLRWLLLPVTLEMTVATLTLWQCDGEWSFLLHTFYPIPVQWQNDTLSTVLYCSTVDCSVKVAG